MRRGNTTCQQAFVKLGSPSALRCSPTAQVRSQMGCTHRGNRVVFSPLNIFVPKARVNALALVLPATAIVCKTRKRIVSGDYRRTRPWNAFSRKVGRRGHAGGEVVEVGGLPRPRGYCVQLDFSTQNIALRSDAAQSLGHGHKVAQTDNQVKTAPKFHYIYYRLSSTKTTQQEQVRGSVNEV